MACIMVADLYILFQIIYVYFQIAYYPTYAHARH